MSVGVSVCLSVCLAVCVCVCVCVFISHSSSESNGDAIEITFLNQFILICFSFFPLCSPLFSHFLSSLYFSRLHCQRLEAIFLMKIMKPKDKPQRQIWAISIQVSDNYFIKMFVLSFFFFLFLLTYFYFRSAFPIISYQRIVWVWIIIITYMVIIMKLLCEKRKISRKWI